MNILQILFFLNYNATIKINKKLKKKNLILFT